MPKVSAPLLSFDARGQIGKAQVYSSWKGIAYARRYTIPANPNTLSQQQSRSAWRMLNDIWRYAPPAFVAPWNAYAQGKPLTGRNKFFSENQRVFAAKPGPEDISGLMFSPGARGGVPGQNVDVTAGVGTLTVEQDIPPAPQGWTILASVAVAIPQQVPGDPFPGIEFADRETADPGTNVLEGLESGTEYVVGTFLEWTRPDGLIAYSISLNATGTPT
jgi:hypothetical protein